MARQSPIVLQALWHFCSLCCWTWRNVVLTIDPQPISPELINSLETSNFQYWYLCLRFLINFKKLHHRGPEILICSTDFLNRWLTKIGVRIPQAPYFSCGLTLRLILYHLPKCPYGIKLCPPQLWLISYGIPTISYKTIDTFPTPCFPVSRSILPYLPNKLLALNSFGVWI